ncbi:MAG: hypothetical protein VB082_04295 [Christensenella sp.]|nr:hypothetical protein [Christensenella sp.]
MSEANEFCGEKEEQGSGCSFTQSGKRSQTDYATTRDRAKQADCEERLER